MNNKNPNSAVSVWLRRLMRDKNLTIHQVAEIACVSARSVSAARAGQKVGLAALERVATALDVTLPEDVRKAAGRSLMRGAGSLGADGRQDVLYCAFHHMHARCSDPKHPSFANYGGAVPAVTVDPRWAKTPEGLANFRRDMGPRPSKQHSLDRKDAFKGYSPENCHWALPAVQGKNKRRPFIFNGKPMTAEQLTKKLVANGVAFVFRGEQAA